MYRMTIKQLIKKLESIENKDLYVLNDDFQYINEIYVEVFQNEKTLEEKEFCCISHQNR